MFCLVQIQLILDSAAENACPEKDFVKFCLERDLTIESIVPWTEKHGWSQVEYSGGAIFRKFRVVRSPDRSFDMFHHLRLDLGDAALNYCGYTHVPFKENAICDPTFPMIARELPKGTAQKVEIISESATTHSWTYRDGAIRGNIEIRLRDGRVWHITLTAIEYPIKRDEDGKRLAD